MQGTDGRDEIEIPEIRQVDPLLYSDAIKALFAGEDREGFDQYFDRCYPSAVANGARSWIGLDAGGEVVMHLARMPHPFTRGSLVATGGLIANIMVASHFRKGAPARALFRRLLADSKADGTTDFLYTETTGRAARAMEESGFQTAATIRRHVLPLSDSRVIRRAVIAARAALIAIRLGSRKYRVERLSVAEAEWDLEADGQYTRVRTRLTEDHVASRLDGYPGRTDWILDIRDRGSGGSICTLLVRSEAESGVATLLRVRERVPALLPTSLHRAGDWLRQQGVGRFQVATVAASGFAADLRRAGFLAREGEPLVVAPLNPHGEAMVDAIPSWQITQLDLDS